MRSAWRGHRDHLLVETGAALTALGFEPPPFPVTIQLTDGRTFTTVFRSRLGRRARSQVEAYDWSGDDRG